MNTRLLVSVLAGLLLSSCTGLIIRDDDSTALVAGKVAARVPLCLLTGCITEVLFPIAKDQERFAENQRSYRQWVQTLPPEQQAIEAQREHERSLAAMQALGLALSGRGPTFYRPAPTYVPPPIRSYEMPTVQPRQPLNCTSSAYGNQVYTNCF